jgi:NADPH2:quinone reductase
MQALICHAFGPIEQLKIESISDPTPLSNEVVIDIAYASVNFPDVLMAQGLYQTKPPFPFSPGHEISGVVSQVGSAINHLKVGQRVYCFANYGGFAEKIAVDANLVLPLPEDIPLDIAASITLTYGTSLHALRNIAKLQVGETLLVLGASGGVGMAAIEIAKMIGAHVIACVSSAQKAQFCRDVGADHIINYEEEDLRVRVKEITNGQGCHVVYDPVGGRYSEIALRNLTWRGRYLVVGFASGEIPKIPLNLALLSERSIMGVFWGEWVKRNFKEHIACMQYITKQIQNGSLKPKVTECFSFQNSIQAMEHLASRNAMGKVVIEINKNL